MEKTVENEDPPEIRIKVTMDGDKPVYEFLIGNLSFGRVPAKWILEAIREFAGSLRWEK
ncbi:hypothetical protein [Rhizobium freirei]|uniref:hypothetical protein n=1 Tax=Rhizobium freirei TaxID=1353277 RepID=UPI0003A08A59|nr:hypothetical protein [Rhizobium freirei]